MRPRSIAVGTATLIAAASMTPVMASADSTNTLYVNNISTNCTDSGTGTVDAPFCTIQAAADAASPGDTVDITATATAYAATTITRSGTADAPIVFTGNMNVGATGFSGGAVVDGLDLSGASNVEIDNLRMAVATGYAAVVDSGSDDTFAHDYVLGATTAGAGGVHITDSASGVTVLDSSVQGPILVDGGATGTVLTTNVLNATTAQPLTLDGAVSTAVTSNTITGCGPAVSVTDSSAGTRLENNIVFRNSNNGNCANPLESYGLYVDESSASGTMADYNDVYTTMGAAYTYDWAGTVYSTAAALYSAVGQGEHDNNSLLGSEIIEKSPAINSADSAAVGEQPVDIRGYPRVLDPLVTPTGAGPDNDYDRGATQFQDPVTPVTKSLTSGNSATKVPVGTSIPLTAAMTDTWSDALTYTFTANGTTLATGTDGNYTASFATPGEYTISVSAKPSNGSVTTASSFASLGIDVVPVAPLVVNESLASDRSARGITASDIGTTDDWNITKVVFDFGDGTPTVTTTDGAQVQHTYAKGGTYNVTETVTDADGNTQSTTGSVTTLAPAAGTLTDTDIATDGYGAVDSYTPPSGSNITQVAVTGFSNGTAQAVAVTKTGTLEFATRSYDGLIYYGVAGTWSAWTTLSQPGVTVTNASIAGMRDGSSQIIEVTSTGQLRHDIRYANGTWQASGWGVPAGSTGIKQAAITAMPNGNTQLVAVTTSGTLLHNIRFANPASWQGWRVISQPGVTVTDASIAGMPDGSSQLVEVTSTGELKHNIRLANNTWQAGGWGVPVGSTGIVQASITALPNDDSETIAVTTAGTIETDRRNTAPKWSGWMSTGLELLNGSETYASDAGMLDNSAQVLLVNGG